MGAFDKKKALGIGAIITIIGFIITGSGWIMEFVANYYQAKEGIEKSKNSETVTSVVETVEKTTKATKAEQEDVIEVDAVEQAEPETEPPTEQQPTAVYLDSLKVAESNNFYEDENNVMDTVGNTYTNHILTVGTINYVSFYDSNNDNYDYGTYYLGGKYKTLSGTIAVNDKSLNNVDEEISILCDDEIVYTTGQVSRAFEPTEVSINVENCQWLTIKIFHYKDDINWNLKCMNFILSDFKLE